jgi:hypothetical protein
MYHIKVDETKNRLYISINGTLPMEEAQKAKRKIEFSITQLKPGFDVINDISKLIRADDIAGSVLKEIMILLIQKGVRRVIRVVGTSKIGLIQFANNSLQIEQYKLSYVPSLEEAEKLLNEPEK